MIRRLAPTFVAVTLALAALGWWLAADPHSPGALTVTVTVGYAAILTATIAGLAGERRYTDGLNDRAAELHAQARHIRTRREGTDR